FEMPKKRDGAREHRLERENLRTKWLLEMNRKSQPRMSILRKAIPRVYGWLLQNDRDWLNRNRPKPIKRQIVKFSVDWKRRDSEYNALVKQAANRIRTANRRPVRITKTAIGKDLGVVSMFQKHIDKLPLTKRTLTSVIESSA